MCPLDAGSGALRPARSPSAAATGPGRAVPGARGAGHPDARTRGVGRDDPPQASGQARPGLTPVSAGTPGSGRLPLA